MARDTITFSITVKSTNSNAVHWNGGCKRCVASRRHSTKIASCSAPAQVDGRLTKFNRIIQNSLPNKYSIQRCLFTLRSFTSKIIQVEVSKTLQCPICGQLASQISKLSLGEVKNVLGRVQRRWKIEHGLFLYCFERALCEQHHLVFCGLGTVQSISSYRVFSNKHGGLHLRASARHCLVRG